MWYYKIVGATTLSISNLEKIQPFCTRLTTILAVDDGRLNCDQILPIRRNSRDYFDIVPQNGRSYSIVHQWFRGKASHFVLDLLLRMIAD